MSNYEKDLKKNIKRNQKFLSEFEDWLNGEKLSSKTINKHLNNIDFYINDYLNYYEVTKMEDGIAMAYNFLNDWFIRKCSYSTMTSIKENAVSIKKFYKCMCEKNYISNEDYNFLYNQINENMDIFFDSLQEYEEELDKAWDEWMY